MSIKAIIFDVGGVLVRTEDREPRRSLAKSFGMSYANIDALVFGGDSGRAAQLGAISAADHWAHIGRTLNLSQDQLLDFQAEFFGGDVLDREMVAQIRKLKSTYTTAVLSNMMDDLRSLLVDHWKISAAFDHLIISAEERVMKPDPRIYEIALDRCGVSPGEAVFIDDFEHNIAGAEALGMQGVRFRDKAQAFTDLHAILNTSK